MIDFTGTNEAVSTTPKYAKPGIDVYTIDGMEFKTNKNNNPYVWISFINGSEESFRNIFYLTPDSISKVQHLAKAATGDLLTGQLSNEQIEAKLVGKKVRLKVDGLSRNKDGKVIIFADLGFSNFAEPINTETKFKSSDIKVKEDESDIKSGSTKNDSHGGLVVDNSNLPF